MADKLTPWYPPHIKPVRVDEKISYCRECFGKGWNDNWRKISSHYMGGEVFREECESCQGTGKTSAGAAYPNPRRTDMDKATPTPSPASVDSVMALADAYSLEAHRDGWKRDNGRSLNHHTAESRLRAEVERLAQAAPTDYYTACEQQNIALLSAMGYPHEKDSLVSPEEYAADLKRKADLFDVAAQAVRMLTREELNDVALSEQVGWGPGEYVEAVQRKFAEVNGLRIPADGKIGSAA